MVHVELGAQFVREFWLVERSLQKRNRHRTPLSLAPDLSETQEGASTHRSRVDLGEHAFK